jgi:hypothetical protein
MPDQLVAKGCCGENRRLGKYCCHCDKSALLGWANAKRWVLADHAFNSYPHEPDLIQKLMIGGDFAKLTFT